jgi:transposase-like protein
MTVIWTPEMKASLVKLRLAGENFESVAESLGVGKNTALSYCHREGIPVGYPGSKDFLQWFRQQIELEIRSQCFCSQAIEHRPLLAEVFGLWD